MVDERNSNYRPCQVLQLDLSNESNKTRQCKHIDCTFSQFTPQTIAKMYIFSFFVSLWLVQTVTADSFYGGYSQSTEYCGVVKIGGDKSNPGIECQVLFSGEYVTGSAKFGDFLVNDQGQLKYGARYVNRGCWEFKRE